MNDPNNSLLQQQIRAAERRLRNRLERSDVGLLGISQYSQRYLGQKLRNPSCTFDLYRRLLHLSLRQVGAAPAQCVLVDYGGGTGLLSFLAKEMGVGTVIYNDIYDGSCADVRRLSNALGITLDHIVCGDLDDLLRYLNRHTISINVIASYDVLEHIYELASHFKRLASAPGGAFRVVYGSGANSANPRCVHRLKKQHIAVELQPREKKWGDKERDSLGAYRDLRRDIVAAYAPDLNPQEVSQLADLTRGLIRHDIERCVDEYRREGCIAYRPNHPTNTCDPYTGNWCEHLMEFAWLNRLVRDAGFSVEILPGYCDVSGSWLRRGVNLARNVLIATLGRFAMPVAPYFVLYAHRLASVPPLQTAPTSALP